MATENELAFVDQEGVGTLTETFDGRYADKGHSHALQDLSGVAAVSQMPEGFVQQFAMSESDWAALPASSRVAGALYHVWKE